MIRRLFAWTGLRHTRRSPGLFVLSAVGIALGVAVFVAIQVANRTVIRTFAATVDAVAGRANLEIAGGSNGLPDSLYVVVRRLPEVEAATPVVGGRASLPDHPGEVVELVGVDPFSNGPFSSYEVAGFNGDDSGNFLRWIADPRGALIPESLAGELGLGIGDGLRILTGTEADTLILHGLLRFSGEVARTAERILVLDVAAAQELTGKVGRLDRIDLIAAGPDSLAAVLSRPPRSLLPADATVRRPAARTAQVETMLAAFRLNLTALSLIALFVGTFLIYNAATTSVVRRRREIGILRALGTSRKMVRVLVLAEAAVLGAVGIAAGLGLGLLLARSILSSIARTVSALYVQVAVRDLFVESRVLVVAVLAGAAAVLAAAWVPAREASELEPQVVLTEGRHPAERWLKPFRLLAGALAAYVLAGVVSLSRLTAEHPAAGFLAALLILVGGALAAPAAARGLAALASPAARASVSARLARGELRTSLRRAAVTVAALGSALAMVFGVSIMIESFRRTVDIWIGQTVRADLYVSPASYGVSGAAAILPPEVAEEVARLPGIRALDELRIIEGLVLDGQPLRARAVRFDVLAGESTFLFRKGDAAAILAGAAREGAVVVSEPLARHRGLAEGDTLRLDTPAGARGFPIAGVYYDYSSDSGVVLFDLEMYRQVWNDRAINSLGLYLEDPLSADRLRARIANELGRRHELLIRSHRDIREAALAQFDQTFAVTMTLKLVTVIVAMAGVFFTLTVSVTERRAEFGVLRAIGATASHIRRLVLAEAVLIGLASLAVGTVTGIALALLLVFVINPQFFGWTIHWVLSPRVMVEAVAVVVAASLLAAWLPSRAAMRSDPAASLREE